MTTALVTGASSGIGMAFARRLAARGDDLVIVARNEGRLKELADEIQSGLRREVEVLPADLTLADDVGRVEQRLQDAPRPVDLLVNNAGFGTAGKFVELPVGKEDEEIRLNVLALMRLTRAALPGMIERGRGGVINVSSVGGFQPGPRNATYSATKAFVTSFSEAVHEELRGTGVNLLALCPGFTRTEFQERGGFDTQHIPKAAWQTPEVVVDAALDALARGRALCVPGLQNKFAVSAVHLAPRGLVRRVSAKVAERF
jgi:short-subunit dehydrogenase